MATPGDYERHVAAFAILASEMVQQMKASPLAPVEGADELENCFLISLKGLLAHTTVAQYWFERWREAGVDSPLAI